MEAVDRQLADLFTAVYQPGFMLISTLVIVTFTVAPFVLLYLPVAYFFRKWSKIYMASAREIKRLNSNSRSPVFQSKRCCSLAGFPLTANRTSCADFNETLNGLTTIRAYGASDRFVQKNNIFLDFNTATLRCQDAAIRWFAMRMQFCSASIVLIATMYITVMQTRDPGSISAGMAGLTLSYAISSTLVCQAATAAFTALEVGMNSVERIQFYAEVDHEEDRLAGRIEAPPEPALTRALEPGGGWPWRGGIELRNVGASYRPELGRVLDGVSFTIHATQKVGVCGRTVSASSGLPSTVPHLSDAPLLSSGLGKIDAHAAAVPLPRVRRGLDPHR